MKIFDTVDGTKATIKQKAITIGVLAGIGILISPAAPVIGIAGAFIAGEGLVRMSKKNKS